VSNQRIIEPSTRNRKLVIRKIDRKISRGPKSNDGAGSIYVYYLVDEVVFSTLFVV